MDECDEILVYMDFNTEIDNDLFKSDKEFKIIGIESDQPILQLGNQVFQGEWKDSLGTHVFFEQGEPIGSDPLFSNPPEKQMHYKIKTNKVLQMSRIFANPKKTAEEIPGECENNFENDTT